MAGLPIGIRCRPRRAVTLWAMTCARGLTEIPPMNKPDIDPVTRHCSSCDGIHYGDTGDCVYKRTPMPPEKPTTWPDSPAEKMRMEAHDAAITLAHTGDYGPVFRAIDALADALVKASSTMPESPAPQPAPCRICVNPMQEPNRAF